MFYELRRHHRVGKIRIHIVFSVIIVELRPVVFEDPEEGPVLLSAVDLGLPEDRPLAVAPAFGDGGGGRGIYIAPVSGEHAVFRIVDMIRLGLGIDYVIQILAAAAGTGKVLVVDALRGFIRQVDLCPVG